MKSYLGCGNNNAILGNVQVKNELASFFILLHVECYQTQERRITKLSIVIDNFLHPNILAVLETYINDVPILQVRLLTRSQNNSNFKSFISDLQLLAQQYPSRLIEAKENNKCHGRFIIVDRKVVYHSGHSFHDLGKKADHINKIENTDEVQKVITDFENWWLNGSSIK